MRIVKRNRNSIRLFNYLTWIFGGWLLLSVFSCNFRWNDEKEKLSAESFYSSDYFIDALDQGSWSGLVFVHHPQDKAYAFRFGTFERVDSAFHYISGTHLDGKVNWANNGDSLYHHITKVGFKSSNGRYAELQWRTHEDLWDLQWARTGPSEVSGSLSLTGDQDNRKRGIVVECYFPWDYPGAFIFQNGHIVSTDSVFQTWFNRKPDFWAATEENPFSGKEIQSLIESKKQTNHQGHFLYLFFENIQNLQFLGKLDGLNFAEPNWGDYNFAKIREEELSKRKKPEGKYPEAIAALADNLNWMISYVPHTDLVYLPAGRTWDWGGWAMFEWDAFFNSLLLCYDNPEMAFLNLKALYAMQYPNGNIPNYICGVDGSRGHSQPPVGAYLVWQMYEKTGNKAFLEISYEPLKKWYFWWREKVETGFPRRDGNGDGLMEWGEDMPVAEKKIASIRPAKFESGMDDSPLWDEAEFIANRWTMNLNSVGLNSMHALDAMHMAKIAKELKRMEEVEQFEEEYDRLKKLIQLRLWNDKQGLYFDKFWNNEFSTSIGPDNFYPILADIPTDEQKERMLIHLMDTTKLWGKYMVPSISKDHPAYKDQQYWRGSVWPPTNYFIYEALKLSGRDSLAQELALKSMDMFMKNYREKGGACQENYNSITGEGDGQKYQSWGTLFPYIYLEEFGNY